MSTTSRIILVCLLMLGQVQLAVAMPCCTCECSARLATFVDAETASKPSCCVDTTCSTDDTDESDPDQSSQDGECDCPMACCAGGLVLPAALVGRQIVILPSTPGALLPVDWQLTAPAHIVTHERPPQFTTIV